MLKNIYLEIGYIKPLIYFIFIFINNVIHTFSCAKNLKFLKLTCYVFKTITYGKYVYFLHPAIGYSSLKHCVPSRVKYICPIWFEVSEFTDFKHW